MISLVYWAMERSVLLSNISLGDLFQKRNTFSKKLNVITFNLREMAFCTTKQVNYQSTSYELRVIILTSCVHYTSYELHLLHKLQFTFAFELQVTVYYTSQELYLLQGLQVAYCMQVTRYFMLLCKYELR